MRHVFAPLFALALLATQASCTTKTVSAPAPAGQSATEEPAATEDELPPEAQAEKFGAALDPNTPVVTLSEVLANPESFKDKNIMTTGNVRQVCQSRGCWAEIRPTATSEAAATMRVTFKGYAFFLPKDSKGSDVKIEGRVSVELLDAENVAHLEAEGATFPNKNADGSALVTEFVASGVELTRPAK